MTITKIVISVINILIYSIFFTSCNKDESYRDDRAFIKFYGSSNLDKGYDVKQVSEDGFIITGEISDSAGIDTDIIVIRTDKSGNELWSKILGNQWNESGKSVYVTNQGDVFVLCNIIDDKPGYLQKDIKLLRFDKEGKVIFERNFGSYYQEGNQIAYADEEGSVLLRTNDGHFVVVGSTTTKKPTNPLAKKDVFLIKISENGDSLWSNSFGGANDDIGNYIIQNANHEFIITGETKSFSEPGQGGSNILVVETNQLGIIKDFVTFGGMTDDVGTCIQSLPDGGYILTGTTVSSDRKNEIVVIRIENMIHNPSTWYKTFGTASDDEAECIKIFDDRFIVGGCSSGFGEGNENMYLFFIDANGNVINELNFGSEGDECLEEFEITNDGSLVLIGYSEFKGNSMITLIKTLPDGSLK